LNAIKLLNVNKVRNGKLLDDEGWIIQLAFIVNMTVRNLKRAIHSR